MLTFSEKAAVIAFWALLLTGVFFAVRAIWRRRQQAGAREKTRAVE